MRIGSFKRLFVLMCTLCFVLSANIFACVDASASEQNGVITLTCRTDADILTGMKWNLYRVGSRSGDAFILEGDFSKYPVVIDDFSASAINSAAKTLENYAVLDKITPLFSGATDENGMLQFLGLSDGLYLVIGETLIVDNTIYVPSAMLYEISTPNNELVIDAYPKIVYRTSSNSDSNYTVKKIWQNSANQTNDVSITVGIYRNAELFETVTLNQENDWTYSWSGSADDEWRVKEVDVPEGYTVSYDFNSTQYVIVNTYSETTTTTTVTTTTTATPSEPGLPQTGQLWWPVVVFGMLGVIFVAIGCRINAERKRDED